MIGTEASDESTFLAVEYERQAESDEMLKKIFRPMRSWYRKNAALKSDHGRFPMFWQDLRKWKEWSAVYRIYMKTIDQKEVGVADGNGNAAEPSAKSDGAEAKKSDTAEEEEKARDKTSGRRRRKSRWGGDSDEKKDASDELAPKKKKRRSRWESASSTSTGKSNLGTSALASFMSPQQLECIQIRAKITELNKQINDDTNMDDGAREKIVQERDTAQKRLTTLLAESSNGAGNAVSSGKRLCRKLYVPVKEYPNYNFIGLIIGPRGNTHRKMEEETGCKIAIRGKGSNKDGKKSYTSDEDDLHVVITGTDEESVSKAESMVAELLVPIEDDQNQHKQNQLRELALINGTLQEDKYCTICGEKGHRQFECPNRHKSKLNFKEIRCAICGGIGHLTRDCKGKNVPQQIEMDKEYLQFMEELGERVEGANTTRAKPPQCVVIGATKDKDPPTQSGIISTPPSDAPVVTGQTLNAPARAPPLPSSGALRPRPPRPPFQPRVRAPPARPPAPSPWASAPRRLPHAPPPPSSNGGYYSQYSSSYGARPPSSNGGYYSSGYNAPLPPPPPRSGYAYNAAPPPPTSYNAVPPPPPSYNAVPPPPPSYNAVPPPPTSYNAVPPPPRPSYYPSGNRKYGGNTGGAAPWGRRY